MNSQLFNFFKFKPKFLTVILLVVASFFSLQKVTAQVANYSFTETNTTATYVPITGGTVFASSSVSGGIVNVTPATPTSGFGFSFNFNGINYDGTSAGQQCWISDNGFITFGTTPAQTTYVPISQTLTSYAGAISAMSANIGLVNAATNSAYPGLLSEIRYETIGVAPNRVFVVQYKNMIRKNASIGTSTGLLNMQIRLNETSNVIDIVYDVMATSPVTIANLNSGQQIGLRGSSNTDFKNLKSTWGVPAVLGTVNNDSVIVSSIAGQYPATVTRYTWTPPCFQPTAPAVTLVTGTTATLSWTAPVLASATYNYEVRTSGAFGTAGAVASGTTALLTQNFTGLAKGTNYTYHIQSACGGTPTSGTFTTLCPARTIPYLEDFSSAVVPALPLCNTFNLQVTSPVGNAFITKNAVVANGSYSGNHLVNNLGGNSWYFTEKITFPAAGTYKLSFKYGRSSNLPFAVQKMKVFYGPNNTITSGTMTGATLLEDYSNIRTSNNLAAINFVVAAAGDYYMGYQCYSDPAVNNGILQLDNIKVESSNCLQPTAVSAVNITSNSALLTWTAPTPAPFGYVYYYSTSPAAPLNSNTTGNGSTLGTSAVTGLLGGGLNYYVWVRSVCDFGDEFGPWTPLTVPGAFFTTPAPINYCASSSTGGANHITSVSTTGGGLNISNLSSGYSDGGYGNFTNLEVTQAAGGSVNLNLVGIVAGGVGYAVYIDWNGDADFLDANETVFTVTAQIFSPPIPVINIVVPPGTSPGPKRMRILLDFNLPAIVPPCNITTNGETEDYTFKVVGPPPALTISSASSTQCALETSPVVNITSSLASYNTFVWTPAAGVTQVSATGYTFNKLTSQEYTLTATKTVAPFDVNSVKFNYIAVDFPTNITFSEANVPITTKNRCEDAPPTEIKAVGGIVLGVPIPSANFSSGFVEEDFNSGAAGWTMINNSTFGANSPACSSWRIRDSGTVLAQVGCANSPTALINLTSRSNDNSKFIISDTDSQGSDGENFNILTSPSFSLVGFADANLSFYHHLRIFNTIALVEISTDGGSNWLLLKQWNTTLAAVPSVGTSTNFQRESINLNAYAGQSNVKIRFNYKDRYGYYWSIDNFKILGGANSIAWNTQIAPVANGVAVPGLYTNAAGSAPYIAGNFTAVIYADPIVNITYVATSKTTGTVCTETSTIDVLVTPIARGTVSSAQTICSGAPVDLVLAGNVGTVTGWQYSTDGNINPTTKAFVTPVNIPATAGLTTLPSATMGNLTDDRWYMATITNSGPGGGCTTYTAPIKITINKSTWNGTAWSNGAPSAITSSKIFIFDGNYTSAANATLNMCSLQVKSGNVVMSAGTKVTVANTVNTIVSPAIGTLTFESGSSLHQPNAVTNAPGVTTGGNIGNIIYKRDSKAMVVQDYTYWSSPVAGQEIHAIAAPLLSDPSKVLLWDNSANYWSATAATYNMVAGQGYAIQAPNTFNATPTIVNGKFTGVPNNGTFTYPLGWSATSDLNLVGNPYPSVLDADKFLNANLTNIYGSLYFWTHNTSISGGGNYTINDYAVYTFIGGIGTGTGTPAPGTNSNVPTKDIATGQGFFVYSKNAANLNFNNSMRFSAAGAFYRNDDEPQVNKSRFWLEMFNNQSAYKQILIGHIDGATNNRDDDYDAYLLDNGTAITMYSLINNEMFSIKANSFPFAKSDVHPIGYKSQIADAFEIKLSDFDGLFVDENIFIEDKLLNIVHDLKQGNYNFTTEVGTFNDRFVIRFVNPLLGNNNFNVSRNNVLVFKNTAGIHIKSINEAIKNVTIFDATGRNVLDKTEVNANELHINKLQVSQQVLLVQVTTTEGKVTTKKIIF